jgi:aspartate racemase
MSKNRTVGILGGMGPAATARFMTLFVRAMNARGIVRDGDFPRTITLGLPLDDWDETGAIDRASVNQQVLNGVHWLVSVGAEIVAVPCNSVHEFFCSWYAPDVVALNIVKETLSIAKGRIGVLCSRQTREANLYGQNVLYVAGQEEVTTAIDGVLRGGAPNIDRLISELHHKGAETVVLGCTELSLCSRTLRAVDSSEVLANALADRL